MALTNSALFILDQDFPYVFSRSSNAGAFCYCGDNSSCYHLNQSILLAATSPATPFTTSLSTQNRTHLATSLPLTLGQSLGLGLPLLGRRILQKLKTRDLTKSGEAKGGIPPATSAPVVEEMQSVEPYTQERPSELNVSSN